MNPTAPFVLPSCTQAIAEDIVACQHNEFDMEQTIFALEVAARRSELDQGKEQPNEKQRQAQAGVVRAIWAWQLAWLPPSETVQTVETDASVQPEKPFRPEH